MILPGSKGWILKYEDLIQKGEINTTINFSKEISKEHFTHINFANSGIIYGIVSDFLFAKSIDKNKWTSDEKLKFLLLESHLFVFILNGGDPIKKFEKFIDLLIEFYRNHNSISIKKMFTFFIKESKIDKLEHILSKRTEVKSTILENGFWFNYLSNSFIYLDVIMFDEFLKSNSVLEDSNYQYLADNTLIAITLSAFSDGFIETREQKMFELFLNSASLSDDKKEKAIKRFKEGANLSDFSDELIKNKLFKRYILDISVFTIYANLDAANSEKKFLNQLCKHLNLSNSELDESIVLVEKFVLNHRDQIAFLTTKNTYEEMYHSISKRWIKILGRNKDKLATELKESKELVYLIKKSTISDLTKEEKEKVKSQFLDIVKSMPALAIFMLPGGALLLPIVLKIIPDLIPSAFRDNEIE
jgi:hypothetical protein